MGAEMKEWKKNRTFRLEDMRLPQDGPLKVIDKPEQASKDIITLESVGETGPTLTEQVTQDGESKAPERPKLNTKKR